MKTTVLQRGQKFECFFRPLSPISVKRSQLALGGKITIVDCDNLNESRAGLLLTLLTMADRGHHRITRHRHRDNRRSNLSFVTPLTVENLDDSASSGRASIQRVIRFTSNAAAIQ